MEKIEFKYSNVAWGHNEEEFQVIDFGKKMYGRIKIGSVESSYSLPEELLTKIEKLFLPIYVEFPGNQIAFDAPMWTLTIDDKSCTRIVVEDREYDKVSRIFEIFKKF